MLSPSLLHLQSTKFSLRCCTLLSIETVFICLNSVTTEHHTSLRNTLILSFRLCPKSPKFPCFLWIWRNAVCIYFAFLRITCRKKEDSLFDAAVLQSVQSSSGARQHPIHLVLGDCFLGGKTDGAWRWRLSTYAFMASTRTNLLYILQSSPIHFHLIFCEQYALGRFSLCYCTLPAHCFPFYRDTAHFHSLHDIHLQSRWQITGTRRIHWELFRCLTSINLML